MHACADIGHISSHLKRIDPPQPQGGLGGYLFSVTIFVRASAVRAYFRSSPCVLSSYYILDRRTAPSDRTAPKFGTHVRIDSLTLKKIGPTPTPGEFRGLSIVKNLSRPNAPKFCTHVRIYSLTSKKNVTHPHPRGV